MGLIEGKVAILTGSGRGIGAATAKMFGAEGASVVVSDLDPTPAEETAAIIRAAGGKAVVVAGDVTDPAFPAQLIQATLDSFGGIDIIVNNAGYTWDAVIQNMTDKQWYAMLDVHTTAPFRILREASQFIREAAKKELAANGRANPRKVVNVTSVSGVYGNAGQANYAASKAGLIGLTMAIAREVGSRNITCNAVAPGFIETAMTANLGDEFKQTAVKQIPLGRVGSPDDVASAVAFLASDEASYITGHVLNVNGGMLMG